MTDRERYGRSYQSGVETKVVVLGPEEQRGLSQSSTMPDFQQQSQTPGLSQNDSTHTQNLGDSGIPPRLADVEQQYQQLKVDAAREEQ